MGTHRALEFYCGIGGLHYSLEAREDHLRWCVQPALPLSGSLRNLLLVLSRRPLQAARPGRVDVVAAFDVNRVGNDVYLHNFGARSVLLMNSSHYSALPGESAPRESSPRKISDCSPRPLLRALRTPTLSEDDRLA